MSSDLGLRIVGALCVAGVFAGLARLALRPPARLALRVRPYTAASRSLLGKTPDRAALLETAPATVAGVAQRLFRPIIDSMASTISRFFGGAMADETLGLKLRQAGILQDIAEEDRVHEYRVRQVSSGLIWGCLLGVLGVLLGNPSAAMLLFTMGVVVGVARKSGGVSRTIEDRRERMRVELYTINQLLAIYLRTSGSPVLAAQRLTRRGRGAVIDELNEALRLHTRGMSASRAFSRIADQTPEPFAARTYKLLASGSERGADLASALLALSEDVREHRRTEVRRTATKRQGAMLVPIIVFLAPVMLLFIAAPLPHIIYGVH